jgi:hypothetical protein
MSLPAISDELDQLQGYINSTTNKFSHSLDNDIDTSIVQTQLNDVSKLGISLGDIGGIVSLNSSSDMVSTQPGSVPVQVVGHIPLAKLTENMPGLKTQLVQDVDPAIKTLNTSITNSTLAAPANLNEVLSLGTTQAISASIKKVIPNVTKKQITTVVNGAVVQADAAVLDLNDPAGGSFESAKEDLDIIINSFNNSIDNIISSVTGTSKLKPGLTGLLNSVSSDILNFAVFVNNDFNVGFGTLIENAIENTFHQGENILRGVAFKGGIQQQITPEDLDTIFNLIKKKNILGASTVLKKYSDLPENQLVDALQKIDNRLSTFTSNKSQDSKNISFINRNIKNIKADWNLGFPKDPSVYFKTYSIFSVEELEVELATIKRPFTELILGFTGAASDQPIDMYSYHRRNAEKYRNSNGLTWHYYLSRSGLISRVRPVELEIGNDYLTAEKNHSARSIFMMIDGGTNTPWYNGYDYKKHAVKDSGINAEQYYAINKFLSKMYYYHSGTQVFGWHEINKLKFPYMDVKNYIKSKFNKVNIFDPMERGSLTLEELRRGKL